MWDLTAKEGDEERGFGDGRDPSKGERDSDREAGESDLLGGVVGRGGE